ncbi:MAG: SulP family inorganic anion transporter [Pseudomonadota bacterium]
MKLDSRNLSQQVSAGIIVGLSAVIYSVAYGALLFSGPLAAQVGFGITITLITAIAGALLGVFSEEKTFISGPDSNTISVLVSVLATVGALSLDQQQGFRLMLGVITMTTVLSALTFYAVAHYKLTGLVRYIPFPVMAGILASTGWLMASGAMNIVAATPFSMAGLDHFLADPLRPELGYALLVVFVLFALERRVKGPLLIPLVMITATLLVYLPPLRDVVQANREDWLFSGLGRTPWLPPWELDWSWQDLLVLLRNAPAMLVVCFVGVLTILLSVASLELNFGKEFDLERVLRAHAQTSVVTAALGGFVGIISIGRTMLNHQTHGGKLAGVIAAGICLAVLLGAGGIIATIPKAALGGLVLYLGLGMLRQWIWNQWGKISLLELSEILLILVLVANFGFLSGFAAGVLISCVMFAVTCSRIPLASLTADLSLLTSSVVRPQQQVEALKLHGPATVVYRLSGYVFFGSASSIDNVFRQMSMHEMQGVVLDFTRVSGIDRSALGVFQRILRRYHALPVRFYLVHAEHNKASLLSLANDPVAGLHLQFFASLDHALEAAEEAVLDSHRQEWLDSDCFGFLSNPEDQRNLRTHCEFRHVGATEYLCREGEFSNEMFFVENGSLDVIKAKSGGAGFRLARLLKGAIVGELAFATGEARTASIVAVTESRVYVLHKDSLTRMRAEHPDLAMLLDQMVIQKISQTLVRTNKLLTTLTT